MKDLSIVIVTWNCKKYTQECLDSLATFRTDPQTEIILVDNASIDGTPELVRNFYPEVTLIASKENLGFARGNNVGLRRVSGRYVCLINPDVKVLDHCIEKMVDYMQNNPRAGLLGPRMLGADMQTYRSYMGEPTLWRMLCRALALDVVFPKSKLFGGFLMPYLVPTDTCEVEILNGWFWMTPKGALEEVGLLDEELFMYADDLDWSKRFRSAGWKVVYFPEAAAIHYGGATTARSPVRFSVEMQRSNFRYWKKNYGPISQFFYRAIVWLHQVIRMLAYVALMGTGKSRREEATFKIHRSFACMMWAMGFGSGRGVQEQDNRRQAQVSS